MHHVIDPTRVSHERLQDEVIIINLASGSYFSGSGTAADLWTLISAGTTIDEAVGVLTAAYGADIALVRREVEACVQMLLDRDVIAQDPSAAHPCALPTLPEISRNGWTAPTFDEYTDMWDLLQADPIHDVGDAGWPFTQPQPKE